MNKMALSVLALCSIVPIIGTANAVNTTTLTAIVPDASYTLKIPADLDIPYRSTKTELELLTISESVGFEEGKNLKVTMTYDALQCRTTQTVIPYILEFQKGTTGVEGSEYIVHTGDSVTFVREDTGMLQTKPVNGNQKFDSCFIRITDEAWNVAQPGTYSATITYAAEVVKIK